MARFLSEYEAWQDELNSPTRPASAMTFAGWLFTILVAAGCAWMLVRVGF